jgi:type VI secretion system protein
MQLKMTVASAQARSLGPDAVAHFRLRGGTLGRSRDNDWVLPDPQSIVSGYHARIIYEQGTYYIEDSSTNGTFLNQTDTPLPKGQPVALDHGDILYIGDYEIQVELLEDPLPSSAFDPDSARPESLGGEFVARPYVPQTSLGEPSKRDANMEHWSGASPIPREVEHHTPEFEPASDVGEARVQDDHLPADKQHYRPPTARPELITEDVPPPVSEVLPADWWKMDEESTDSIKQSQALSSPPGAESPVPSAAEPVAPIPQGESPFAASTPKSAASQQPPPAAGTPAASAARPAKGGRHAPSLEVPSAPGGDPLVAAFFEELGLPAVTLSPEEKELLMRRIGRLLRLLTQGTIEVLQARSALKGEFRLFQTVMHPSENNPLKFSLDAEQALRQLFIERRAGFMGPEAAFAEALKDIKQHEIAVVAGMRAAFNCLLRKLSPEAVEAALRASGKRGSILRIGDKTWDFYQSFYADFKAAAGDDFQGIFGEDFVRAYEEQLALLTSHDKGQ